MTTTALTAARVIYDSTLTTSFSLMTHPLLPSDASANHPCLHRICERYGPDTVRRFYERLVEQSDNAGLIFAKELDFDGTQVEANADIEELLLRFYFFFFNDPAPPEFSPLPLHAPLPICAPGRSSLPPPPPRLARLQPTARCSSDKGSRVRAGPSRPEEESARGGQQPVAGATYAPSLWRPDRKSTRLNSSHLVISYAVFCL